MGKYGRITPAQARLNLSALDVMTGKADELKLPQKRTQNEAKIQKAIFDWRNLHIGKYPELKLLMAIPNGGKRDAIEGYNLKRQGVLAGASDIHLPVPRGRYASLWIELKAGNNKPTEQQQSFMDEANQHGNFACVAYGFDEAVNIIEWYLKGAVDI